MAVVRKEDGGVVCERCLVADSAWLPLVGNTTPDPSYPGAHAAISAVASQVLEALLGTDRLSFDVTSEVMPFRALSALARLG